MKKQLGQLLAGNNKLRRPVLLKASLVKKRLIEIEKNFIVIMMRVRS